MVQTLRRGARAHGVDQVPDNAGRDRVKAMALELLAADDLSDDEQEDVEAAWVQYRDSFPDWAVEV